MMINAEMRSLYGVIEVIKYSQVPTKKQRRIAVLLSLFGFLGIHRFYLGRFWTGLLMMVTFGGFGLWWLIDFILLITGKFYGRIDVAKSDMADGIVSSEDCQEVHNMYRENNKETRGVLGQEDATVRSNPNLRPKQVTEPMQRNKERAMSKISLVGQTKVSTLQKRFSAEFGLTIRIYDGRSFADPSATIGQIRRKQGAKHIEIRRNTKVGNLEQKFLDEAGIKVQIAGSDDSYLCDNNLTLKAALEEDNRKLANKRPTYSEAFKNEVVAAANEPGASMQEIADRFGVSYVSVSNWKQSNSADGEPNSVNADQTVNIPDELRELLYEAEEIIEEKGVVIKQVDFDTYGMSLECEEYEDGEYKVTISILVEDISITLDEETAEEVSDAVQDFLDFKLDFEERLENIGIDREALSWWPVILRDVND